MSSPHAQVPTNSIEDSIEGAHQAASRAEGLLDAIWSDLAGEESACDLPSAGPGLVNAAQALNSRIQTIAERLEATRFRIASPKVTQLASAGQTQSARSGYFQANN